MEQRARQIFRDALFKHYIDEIPCGDEVELWLKTHGGWFPDSQVMYGDGTPMTQPTDEGVDVTSAEPEKALQEAKERLQANGVEVLGPTNHTIFKSIYFFDPNGHRLELAADVGTEQMYQKLDACKWDMLQEWSQTKRAPKHAAWMHEQD